METVSLPTRLRPYHDFEASLAGDDSIHKIFELQSTIVRDDADSAKPHTSPSTDAGQTGSENSPIKTEFDLDFAYDGLESQKSHHIFNQLQVSRGVDNSENEASGEDQGILRRRRHYNSEPLFQRSGGAPNLFPAITLLTGSIGSIRHYHCPFWTASLVICSQD